MRLIPLTVLLLTFTVLAGCTPWATYPPIEGAASIDDPQLAPIPSLMARAIVYGHETYGAAGAEDEPIVFNLPAGTPTRVYETVAKKIGNARPMGAGDDHAYHVTTVRVRATDAEVDLITPRADGHHELVEISFKQHFDGYRVDDARIWRIHVNVPEASYVAYPGRDDKTAVVVESPTPDE